MQLITIVCPFCRFSKEVDKSSIPVAAKTVTCPKCKRKFPILPVENIGLISADSITTTEKQNPRISSSLPIFFWISCFIVSTALLLASIIVGVPFSFAAAFNPFKFFAPFVLVGIAPILLFIFTTYTLWKHRPVDRITLRQVMLSIGMFTIAAFFVFALLEKSTNKIVTFEIKDSKGQPARSAIINVERNVPNAYRPFVKTVYNLVADKNGEASVNIWGFDSLKVNIESTNEKVDLNIYRPYKFRDQIVVSYEWPFEARASLSYPPNFPFRVNCILMSKSKFCSNSILDTGFKEMQNNPDKYAKMFNSLDNLPYSSTYLMRQSELDSVIFPKCEYFHNEPCTLFDLKCGSMEMDLRLINDSLAPLKRRLSMIEAKEPSQSDLELLSKAENRLGLNPLSTSWKESAIRIFGVLDSKIKTCKERELKVRERLESLQKKRSGSQG